MKRILTFIAFILVIAFLIWKFWPVPPGCTFSGRVVDIRNQPITNALIQLGERSVETNKNGAFEIKSKCTDRYVLNVTRLGFGFVSKIYTSPNSDVEITMTTATVDEELIAEEVIVIEDDTPITTEPLGDNSVVTSPLDTLPFILDASGSLIGFGNPQQLVDTYQAADQTRGGANRPRGRRTRIEVPANALEDPGETNQGSLLALQSRKYITGSLSTVNIYSSDGMPGDYSVRLADNSIGYMETYGAADVNFYRNNKPLQLRKGMYATLTIPVDTVMLVYYGKKLPETMPLLVYNKKTGEWERDIDKWTRKESLAQLNKERTAYVGKVSHFSVFNMDEEFANPACFKITTSPALVTGGANPSSIQVYVAGHIKPFFPFGNDCLDGSIYAHSIMKMTPFSPMGVRIADNAGQVRSTYVFVAGAASSPSVPVCPYNTCSAAASVELRHNECWMTLPIDGTMQAPILAIRRGADLNSDNTISNDVAVDRNGDGAANLRDNEDAYFTFSWLYIESVTGTTVTNSPMHYQIRYKTFVAGDNFSFNAASDPTVLTVDLDVDLAQQETYPKNTDPGDSDWKLDSDVAFVGNDFGTNTASNPIIASTQIVVFRIDRSSNSGATFIDGTYHVLNMPASTSNFYTSFTGSVSCYTY